jgi:hypothetical protein
VLEVHLNFLLQPDVATYGRLQFLRLTLERLIVVYADKVFLEELEEVVDEVVGQQGFVGGNAGVVAEGRQAVEVEVGGEVAFEGGEDEVAGALEDLLLREGRLLQNALKLFYHLFQI